MAYAEKEDLRLGNIPLPAAPIAQRAVDQAAEEIDAALGFKYITPIIVPAGVPTKQAVDSLLKQVNTFLASGRLILELTAGTEDNSLHSYAKYLVDQATKVLCQIKDGEIVLDGVSPANPDAIIASGPLHINQDSVSGVDRFYDDLSNPVGRVSGDYWPPLSGPSRAWWVGL